MRLLSRHLLSPYFFTFFALMGLPSLQGQTIIPAGFGAMSVTQPSRETAVLTGVLNSTGGQNPTVKIRWGDEDRGTAVTPSTAWDNEVTISTNQAAGTFSTTITIPNLEKVYYFRAIASNSGGTVVSRSLGVLLPSAPVGVANLQGRWNFDGENANDSSGTGRHGTAKKLFSPSELSNMKLWLDAADASTITHSSNAVSQWNDKSGNGNHAIQSTSDKRPTTISNGIQFDGSNDGFNLGNDISEANLNIFFVLHGHGFLYANNGTERTLFYDAGSGRKLWVRINGNEFFAGHSVSGYSDSTTQIHEFSLNSGTFTVRVNGVEALSQASVSGNMKLDRIGLKWDSNTGVPTWAGKLKEILAITTTSNRAAIEGYLAHKWGLVGALDSAHPHKLGAPHRLVRFPYLHL